MLKGSETSDTKMKRLYTTIMKRLYRILGIITLCVVAALVVTIMVSGRRSLTLPRPSPKSVFAPYSAHKGKPELLPKWALSSVIGPTFSEKTVCKFPMDHLKFHAFTPHFMRVQNLTQDLTHGVRSGL